MDDEILSTVLRTFQGPSAVQLFIDKTCVLDRITVQLLYSQRIKALPLSPDSGLSELQ